MIRAKRLSMDDLYNQLTSTFGSVQSRHMGFSSNFRKMDDGFVRAFFEYKDPNLPEFDEQGNEIAPKSIVADFIPGYKASFGEHKYSTYEMRTDRGVSNFIGHGQLSVGKSGQEFHSPFALLKNMVWGTISGRKSPFEKDYSNSLMMNFLGGEIDSEMGPQFPAGAPIQHSQDSEFERHAILSHHAISVVGEQGVSRKRIEEQLNDLFGRSPNSQSGPGIPGWYLKYDAGARVQRVVPYGFGVSNEGEGWVQMGRGDFRKNMKLKPGEREQMYARDPRTGEAAHVFDPTDTAVSQLSNAERLRTSSLIYEGETVPREGMLVDIFAGAVPFASGAGYTYGDARNDFGYAMTMKSSAREVKGLVNAQGEMMDYADLAKGKLDLNYKKLNRWYKPHERINIGTFTPEGEDAEAQELYIKNSARRTYLESFNLHTTDYVGDGRTASNEGGDPVTPEWLQAEYGIDMSQVQHRPTSTKGVYLTATVFDQLAHASVKGLSGTKMDKVAVHGADYEGRHHIDFATGDTKSGELAVETAFGTYSRKTQNYLMNFALGPSVGKAMQRRLGSIDEPVSSETLGDAWADLQGDQKLNQYDFFGSMLKGYREGYNKLSESGKERFYKRTGMAFGVKDWLPMGEINPETDEMYRQGTLDIMREQGIDPGEIDKYYQSWTDDKGKMQAKFLAQGDIYRTMVQYAPEYTGNPIFNWETLNSINEKFPELAREFGVAPDQPVGNSRAPDARRLERVWQAQIFQNKPLHTEFFEDKINIGQEDALDLWTSLKNEIGENMSDEEAYKKVSEVMANKMVKGADGEERPFLRKGDLTPLAFNNQVMIESPHAYAGEYENTRGFRRWLNAFGGGLSAVADEDPKALAESQERLQAYRDKIFGGDVPADVAKKLLGRRIKGAYMGKYVLDNRLAQNELGVTRTGLDNIIQSMDIAPRDVRTVRKDMIEMMERGEMAALSDRYPYQGREEVDMYKLRLMPKGTPDIGGFYAPLGYSRQNTGDNDADPGWLAAAVKWAGGQLKSLVGKEQLEEVSQRDSLGHIADVILEKYAGDAQQFDAQRDSIIDWLGSNGEGLKSTFNWEKLSDIVPKMEAFKKGHGSTGVAYNAYRKLLAAGDVLGHETAGHQEILALPYNKAIDAMKAGSSSVVRAGSRARFAPSNEEGDGGKIKLLTEYGQSNKLQEMKTTPEGLREAGMKMLTSDLAVPGGKGFMTAGGVAAYLGSSDENIQQIKDRINQAIDRGDSLADITRAANEVVPRGEDFRQSAFYNIMKYEGALGTQKNIDRGYVKAEDFEGKPVFDGLTLKDIQAEKGFQKYSLLQNLLLRRPGPVGEADHEVIQETVAHGGTKMSGLGSWLGDLVLNKEQRARMEAAEAERAVAAETQSVAQEMNETGNVPEPEWRDDTSEEAEARQRPKPNAKGGWWYPKKDSTTGRYRDSAGNEIPDIESDVEPGRYQRPVLDKYGVFTGEGHTSANVFFNKDTLPLAPAVRIGDKYESGIPPEQEAQPGDGGDRGRKKPPIDNSGNLPPSGGQPPDDEDPEGFKWPFGGSEQSTGGEDPREIVIRFNKQYIDPAQAVTKFKGTVAALQDNTKLDMLKGLGGKLRERAQGMGIDTQGMSTQDVIKAGLKKNAEGFLQPFTGKKWKEALSYGADMMSQVTAMDKFLTNGGADSLSEDLLPAAELAEMRAVQQRVLGPDVVGSTDSLVEPIALAQQMKGVVGAIGAPEVSPEAATAKVRKGIAAANIVNSMDARSIIETAAREFGVTGDISKMSTMELMSRGMVDQNRFLRSIPDQSAATASGAFQSMSMAMNQLLLERPTTLDEDQIAQAKEHISQSMKGEDLEALVDVHGMKGMLGAQARSLKVDPETIQANIDRAIAGVQSLPESVSGLSQAALGVAGHMGIATQDPITAVREALGKDGNALINQLSKTDVTRGARAIANAQKALAGAEKHGIDVDPQKLQALQAAVADPSLKIAQELSAAVANQDREMADPDKKMAQIRGTMVSLSAAGRAGLGKLPEQIRLAAESFGIDTAGLSTEEIAEAGATVGGMEFAKKLPHDLIRMGKAVGGQVTTARKALDQADATRTDLPWRSDVEQQKTTTAIERADAREGTDLAQGIAAAEALSGYMTAMGTEVKKGIDVFAKLNDSAKAARADLDKLTDTLNDPQASAGDKRSALKAIPAAREAFETQRLLSARENVDSELGRLRALPPGHPERDDIPDLEEQRSKVIATQAQKAAAGIQPSIGERFTGAARKVLGGFGLMYLGHLAGMGAKEAQAQYAETQQYSQEQAGILSSVYGTAGYDPSTAEYEHQAAMRGGGRGFAMMGVREITDQTTGTPLQTMAGSVKSGVGIGVMGNFIAGAFGATGGVLAGITGAGVALGALGYAGLEMYGMSQNPEDATRAYYEQSIRALKLRQEGKEGAAIWQELGMGVKDVVVGDAIHGEDGRKEAAAAMQAEHLSIGLLPSWRIQQMDDQEKSDLASYLPGLYPKYDPGVVTQAGISYLEYQSQEGAIRQTQGDLEQQNIQLFAATPNIQDYAARIAGATGQVATPQLAAQISGNLAARGFTSSTQVAQTTAGTEALYKLPYMQELAYASGQSPEDFALDRVSMEYTGTLPDQVAQMHRANLAMEAQLGIKSEEEVNQLLEITRDKGRGLSRLTLDKLKGRREDFAQKGRGLSTRVGIQEYLKERGFSGEEASKAALSIGQGFSAQQLEGLAMPLLGTLSNMANIGGWSDETLTSLMTEFTASPEMAHVAGTAISQIQSGDPWAINRWMPELVPEDVAMPLGFTAGGVLSKTVSPFEQSWQIQYGNGRIQTPGETAAQIWGENWATEGNVGLRNAIAGTGVTINGQNFQGSVGQELYLNQLNFDAQAASAGNQMAQANASWAFQTGVNIGNYNPINPVTGQAFNVFEGGFWGLEDRQVALQRQQQQWGVQYQRRSMDLQQEGYGLQGQSLALTGRQLGLQEWGLDVQGRGIDISRLQMQENESWFYQTTAFNKQMTQLGRTQQLMGREWTREDWGFQDQTRNLQWQWSQEDFEENVRFMTGRQRKLAERQQERDVTMHGIEGEQIDRGRQRQEQTWKLEDKRFQLQEQRTKEEIKHQEILMQYQRDQFALREEQHEIAQENLEISKEQYEIQKEQYALQGEQLKLQEENMERNIEFMNKRVELEEISRELQRAYQTVQHELQIAAIGTSVYFAEQMKLAKDDMIVARANQTTFFHDFEMFQLNMTLDFIKLFQYVADETKITMTRKFQEAIDGVDFSSWPGAGHALGGHVRGGRPITVGEHEMEVFVPEGSGTIIPMSKVDPWVKDRVEISPTVGETSASQPIQVVVYIGNEKLDSRIVRVVENSMGYA